MAAGGPCGIGLPAPVSERQLCCQLNPTRIAHCSRLTEGRGRCSRIRPGPERSVGNLIVAMIECVERLRNALQLEVLSDREGAAEAGIQRKRAEAYTCVASNHRTGQGVSAGVGRVGRQHIARSARTQRGGLYAVLSCADIERQR
jgi:hypothetical protein